LFAASGDYLRDYAIKNGQLTAIASSSLKFENPGATPAISADGKKNAIPGLSQPSYGMAPIIAQPSSMHLTPSSSANRFIRPTGQCAGSRRAGHPLRHPAGRERSRVCQHFEAKPKFTVR
jgi:hypothetical protein